MTILYKSTNNPQENLPILENLQKIGTKYLPISLEDTKKCNLNIETEKDKENEDILKRTKGNLPIQYYWSNSSIDIPEWYPLQKTRQHPFKDPLLLLGQDVIKKLGGIVNLQSNHHIYVPNFLDPHSYLLLQDYGIHYGDYDWKTLENARIYPDSSGTFYQRSYLDILPNESYDEYTHEVVEVTSLISGNWSRRKNFMYPGTISYSQKIPEELEKFITRPYVITDTGLYEAEIGASQVQKQRDIVFTNQEFVDWRISSGRYTLLESRLTTRIGRKETFDPAANLKSNMTGRIKYYFASTSESISMKFYVWVAHQTITYTGEVYRKPDTSSYWNWYHSYHQTRTYTPVPYATADIKTDIHFFYYLAPYFHPFWSRPIDAPTADIVVDIDKLLRPSEGTGLPPGELTSITVDKMLGSYWNPPEFIFTQYDPNAPIIDI